MNETFDKRLSGAPRKVGDDFLAETMAAKARSAVLTQEHLATNTEWRERQQRIRNALGAAPQIEALRMMRAAEGRSYTPGIDFATTAYLEGRKAALDDLIVFLTQQEAN